MASPQSERDLRLVVANRTELTEDVVLLELRDPNDADLPQWEPGAHVDLRLGGDLVRQYSLCGDPRDSQKWQVGILREPGGRGGSAAAHRLVKGATIDARGPRNHFALVASPRYLFIAGGIGITPILSMIGQARRAGAEWQLVYGGRSRDSMAFRRELEALDVTRVTLWPQDEVGLIDLDVHLSPPRSDTLVYACGPEPLLAAVESRMTAWAPAALHVERFTPKAVGVPVRADAFEIELQRSGLVLMVPPGRTVLDVVSEAGVDVMSSCTEGTCGTCETVVLAGRPDHRDSLLSAAEQETSETMMICVSRSASPRLVLDL